MYELKVCEGIVLGKRGVGEANVLVPILTRELGLVRALARSARAENSKLRYGLGILTLARFSFVRGKQEWKLTGVESVSRVCVSPDIVRARQAGRVVKLLLRLIHGEEVSKELFESVKSGLQVLARARETAEAESIESVLVLKILYHLGYLPHTPELRSFIDADFFSMELAQKAARSKRLLMRAINESLQATGL
jgi:DNA repair protein RecO